MILLHNFYYRLAEKNHQSNPIYFFPTEPSFASLDLADNGNACDCGRKRIW